MIWGVFFRSHSGFAYLKLGPASKDTHG